MPTMKDVAREAGVSVGSVSHYLNEHVPVSPDKARRIQLAIDKLGYRVDQGARSLRRRQTQTVGLIIPDISNPFYAELARVIEHRLWDRGFQTFLCDSAHDTARERAHFASLLDRRADGILAIYGNEDSELPELVDETATPVVFLDRPVEGRHSVASDNYLGGWLAGRHLLELGHTRVGVLVGEAEIANIRERMGGFRDALAAAGVALGEAYIRYGAQELALGERAADLMRLEPSPTAIFATNDIVALGAWRALLSAGVRIPQDVSLVGFDNIEIGRLLVPPLTTVAQDIVALGERATELLFSDKLSSQTVQRVVVPPRVVVGASTAPAKERSRM